MNPIKSPELSLVIPCCNESGVVPLLKGRLLQCLPEFGISWEVIFVDDGSDDSTFEQLCALHREDARFKVLSFSRNFGHQAAISAGLAYSSGRVVGVLDADLQDPPELFAKCLEKLREGYDVVYAVRCRRKENFLRRTLYAGFYRLLRLLSDIEIPLDSGDFCLMNRRVVEVVKQMHERNIFLRGLRAWTGFKQIGLKYERGARAAGKTKYPLKKLIQLGMDGIISFSTLPLRLAIYLGFAAMSLSVFLGLFTLFWRMFGFRFMGHNAAELPGWATLACGLFFFAGLQLLILGCIGEYLGRIYIEIKQRPRWIIRDALGVEVHGTQR